MHLIEVLEALARLAVVSSIRTECKLNTRMISIIFDSYTRTKQDDRDELESLAEDKPVLVNRVKRKVIDEKISNLLNLQIANQHRTSGKMNAHMIGVMFDCWDARGRDDRQQKIDDWLTRTKEILERDVADPNTPFLYALCDQYRLSLANENRLPVKISTHMIGAMLDCWHFDGGPTIDEESDEEIEEELEDTIRSLVASVGDR